MTRLTVIPAEPSEPRGRRAGAPARRRRRRGGRGRRRGGRSGPSTRCCARHRVATRDPYGHEIGREATLVARVGYGTGDGLAEGRWEEAVEVPYPERRRRRAEALRPQERLAAVLAGREPIDVCETLLLRARADLDQGRPREAALQLRAGLDALLAELPGKAPRADQARGPRRPPGAPGEHRRGGRRGACGRAVRRARRRGRRDARHLRARPAPPPDPGGARVTAGYPRAASTELRSSATSPSRRTAAAESYGVELLVTIASRPPLVEGELRQAGDRVDLERGADAEQQLGAGAQALRLRDRAARQELAEQDHVRLHLARAAGSRSRPRRGRTATRPAPADSWPRSSCSSRWRSSRAPRSPAPNPPCDAGDRCSG